MVSATENGSFEPCVLRPLPSGGPNLFAWSCIPHAFERSVERPCECWFWSFTFSTTQCGGDLGRGPWTGKKPNLPRMDVGSWTPSSLPVFWSEAVGGTSHQLLSGLSFPGSLSGLLAGAPARLVHPADRASALLGTGGTEGSGAAPRFTRAGLHVPRLEEGGDGGPWRRAAHPALMAQPRMDLLGSSSRLAASGRLTRGGQVGAVGDSGGAGGFHGLRRSTRRLVHVTPDEVAGPVHIRRGPKRPWPCSAGLRARIWACTRALSWGFFIDPAEGWLSGLRHLTRNQA